MALLFRYPTRHFGDPEGRVCWKLLKDTFRLLKTKVTGSSKYIEKGSLVSLHKSMTITEEFIANDMHPRGMMKMLKSKNRLHHHKSKAKTLAHYFIHYTQTN